MALIKCPECGKEISDKSFACIYCGYPIVEIEQNKESIPINIKESGAKDKYVKMKKKNNKRSIKPAHVFGVMAAVTAISVGVIIFTEIQKRNTEQQEYNNAIQAYEKGNYEEAYEYFSHNEYGESKEYLARTIEKYTEYLIDNRNFSEVDNYLALVKDEGVKQDLEKNLIYAHGIDYFEKGLFQNAIKVFENISDYKDSKGYLANANFMKNIQGKWGIDKAGYISYKYGALVIDGWNATVYHPDALLEGYIEAGTCRLRMDQNENAIFRTNDIKYSLSYYEDISQSGYKIRLKVKVIEDSYFEPQIISLEHSGGETLMFKMIPRSETLLGVDTSKEPKVGMTEEEILKTKWGKPDNINKTTYSWGTTEQWCYPGGKYIYLDDGYVTAISE